LQAPARIAATARSISPYAVISKTGSVVYRRFTSRSSCSPLIGSICTSVTTIPTRSCSMRSSAWLPSVASITRYPDSSSVSRKASRNAASSSTIRTGSGFTLTPPAPRSWHALAGVP
jgi:hypothetical protein